MISPKDYLKHETGTIIKDGKGNPSVALVYPNTYYVGMSNLGFQTVYSLFNQDPLAVCERVFLPDHFDSNPHAKNPPLRTLENHRLIHEFDCVAFSISFESDYLRLLNLLHLGKIPFLAQDRSGTDPIVMAGGAAININPEPIRAFCDVLFVGEAEESISEIAEAFRSHSTRTSRLEALQKIEGVFLASEIHFENDQNRMDSICPKNPRPNRLEKRVPSSHLRQYKRRVVRNLDPYPTTTVIHTPHTEFGKLSLIEVQRGCSRGCKFCAEGFIYAPFRERSLDVIQNQVVEGLKCRNKIGLIGADLLSYPHILELMKFIHHQGGTFSPSSLRLDSLKPEIIEQLVLSGHKTIAIAPEAGSDRLRRKINKHFDNDDVLNVTHHLMRAKIPNIKMYMMIGLPNETETDLNETVKLIHEVRDIMVSYGKKNKIVGNLIISLNPFIPKPHTPFQKECFEHIKTLEAKIHDLKKKVLSKGGIKLCHEKPFLAYIQTLLSNGTSELSDFLLKAHQYNGSLKRAIKPFEDHQKRSY